MAKNVVVPPFPAVPETVVGSTPRSVFDFDFPFWEKADILVSVNGLKLASANYTVQGLAIQNGEPVEGGYGSGRITLNTPVSNCTVKIDRRVKASRETAFSRSSPLQMSALNADLNKLTARQQDYERALRDAEKGVVDPDLLAEVVDEATNGKADRTGANLTASESISFRNVLRQDYLTPEDFGAVGDGVEDDTRAFVDMIQAADSGARCQGVAGKSYVITDTVLITKRLNWSGTGASIRYAWRPEEGGPGFCKPMLVFKPGSEGSRFSDFNMDHDGFDCPGATLAPAPGPGGNDGLALAWQCALIIQASDVNVTNCRIDNGWDNAFTIGDYTVTGSGTPSDPFILPYESIGLGQPKRVTVSNCYAYRSGSGKHHYPSVRLAGDWERVGVGFNNLNAGLARFENCVAYQCRTGFVTDYGAQGSSIFVNCMAYESLEDTHNLENGAGWGFWIADGPNTLVGCQALYCQKEGFVFPYEANGTVAQGCFAFANGFDGFLVGTNKISLTGCVSQANGLRGVAGKDAAYVLDSSGEEITSAMLVGNIALHNGETKYGLVARGPNPITATWMGGYLEGLTAPFNIGTYAVSVFEQSHNTRNFGLGAIDPRSRLEIVAGSSSYKAIPIGDTGNGGGLSISLGSNRNKKIAFGYDNVNDASVIQSLEEGVMSKPLLLNPSGGGIATAGGPAAVASYGADFNPAAVTITRTDNRDKRLAIGWVDEDYAVIQSLVNGVGPATLFLNPVAAPIRTGAGHWNAPLSLRGETGAESFLFVDAAGRLRIKTGAAPTGAADGAVVGTQA